MESPPRRETDPVLQPFLRAEDPAQAARHLEALVAQAEPVINGVIRRKLRARPGADGRVETRESQAAEDVRGEVVLSLLERLNGLRASREGEHTDETIGSFRSFVAVTAYRACDTHLRKQYPRRTGLKSKLAYLLGKRTSQQGFALWQAPDGERWCGFEAWREGGKPLVRSREHARLVENPAAFTREALPGEDPAHVNPAVLLAALFNRVGGPIELDDLVTVLAELWGVKDTPLKEAAPGDEEADPVGRVADPAADVATETEQRAYLRYLWSEVRQLPPRQCAALLLNLRDAEGRGVIALLPLRGVATLREMAAAMEMPAERFAALWNDLPIEDNAIAELLGVTRQQVINLRKVARERLGRRMRAFEGG
jgi:hypothetical protein